MNVCAYVFSYNYLNICSVFYVLQLGPAPARPAAAATQTRAEAEAEAELMASEADAEADDDSMLLAPASVSGRGRGGTRRFTRGSATLRALVGAEVRTMTQGMREQVTTMVDRTRPLIPCDTWGQYLSSVSSTLHQSLQVEWRDRSMEMAKEFLARHERIVTVPWERPVPPPRRASAESAGLTSALGHTRSNASMGSWANSFTRNILSPGPFGDTTPVVSSGTPRSTLSTPTIATGIGGDLHTMQVPQGATSEFYPHHTITGMSRFGSGERVITQMTPVTTGGTGMTPPGPQIVRLPPPLVRQPQQPQNLQQPVMRQPAPDNGSNGSAVTFSSFLAGVHTDLAADDSQE
jgi:hypothetical protein